MAKRLWSRQASAEEGEAEGSKHEAAQCMAIR